MRRPPDFVDTSASTRGSCCAAFSGRGHIRGRIRGRGFATIAALGMVALIAAAMLAMVQRLQAQAWASKQAATDAQLRQMLQIGARVAVRLVPAAADARTWNVALPAELEERGGMIGLRALPQRTASERRIEVTCRLDHRTMRQTLRYVSADNLWGLIEATIESE